MFDDVQTRAGLLFQANRAALVQAEKSALEALKINKYFKKKLELSSYKPKLWYEIKNISKWLKRHIYFHTPFPKLGIVGEKKYERGHWQF